MLLLFTVPSRYFVAATFASTGVMLLGAFALGSLRRPAGISTRSVGLGLASALGLYGLFALGSWAIGQFHPLGVTSASASSIYSLISSPSNPVSFQFAILLFDAAGYESFFRGTLQRRLQPRLGVKAAPLVAALDACLHLATLNLLWVGATFVADLVWGLTYHYGRGAQGSFVSHLLWDVAIFILRPV